MTDQKYNDIAVLMNRSFTFHSAITYNEFVEEFSKYLRPKNVVPVYVVSEIESILKLGGRPSFDVVAKSLWLKESGDTKISFLERFLKECCVEINK